jgi:hypothetical protein
MKRLIGPAAAISALSLGVFLFIANSQVAGQGTLQQKPDARQESTATAPRAAPVSPNEQAATIQQHTLTITKTGNGQGKVINSPPGALFKKGTPVTLQAVPEPNSAFDAWSGSCSGSYRSCSVNMASDRVVTASFSLRTYTIRVRSPVNGVIHPFGAVKATHGEKRRFQIIPLPGYRVSEVLVDKTSVGAPNSYTFNTVTSDHTIEVIFVKE